MSVATLLLLYASTWIMLAIVCHITSGVGCMKFQAAWFLLNRVYSIAWTNRATMYPGVQICLILQSIVHAMQLSLLSGTWQWLDWITGAALTVNQRPKFVAQRGGTALFTSSAINKTYRCFVLHFFSWQKIDVLHRIVNHWLHLLHMETQNKIRVVVNGQQTI
jgi:hypothetical protein